jgi:hypothetical protein
MAPQPSYSPSKDEVEDLLTELVGPPVGERVGAREVERHAPLLVGRFGIGHREPRVAERASRVVGFRDRRKIGAVIDRARRREIVPARDEGLDELAVEDRLHAERIGVEGLLGWRPARRPSSPCRRCSSVPRARAWGPPRGDP